MRGRRRAYLHGESTHDPSVSDASVRSLLFFGRKLRSIRRPPRSWFHCPSSFSPGGSDHCGNSRRPPSTNLRLRSAPPSAIGLKDVYCVARPTHEQQEGGPHTSRSGLQLGRRGTKQTNTKDTNQWSPDDLFVRRFARITTTVIPYSYRRC